MQERHAIAATFSDRMDVVKCIRDLEAQGIREQDIRVLLPPRASGDEFKSEGITAQPVGGGDILDRLASVFRGGAAALSDLAFADQEQDYLVNAAKNGSYVLAVKCNGTCPNIHPILTRYGGRQSAAQTYETTSYRQGQPYSRETQGYGAETQGYTREPREYGREPQPKWSKAEPSHMGAEETSERLTERPLQERSFGDRTSKHAIAAEFSDRMDAINAVRDLGSQGVSDTDILVILPLGSTYGQAQGATGMQPQIVSGGSVLDQLGNLFRGGMAGLSDLGFRDQERQAVEDSARNGHYVVAVKCDGMCPNIHPILTRYNGREVSPQTYQAQRNQPQTYQASSVGTQQPLRERTQGQMGQRTAAAAAFANRTNAENAVRDLEAQGISDRDIRVLLPPGAPSGRFTGETGAQPRIVSGGSLVDQLTGLFRGPTSGLSDLGLSDDEQRNLHGAAEAGEYVVAVKCEGMCNDADAILFRWTGRRVVYSGAYGPQGDSEERRLGEQPWGEYPEDRTNPERYGEGNEGHHTQS